MLSTETYVQTYLEQQFQDKLQQTMKKIPQNQNNSTSTRSTSERERLRNSILALEKWPCLPLAPYCQFSWRIRGESLTGERGGSLPSASLAVPSGLESRSVLPNFSSSRLSFSAQAARRSSRARRSSSSRRLRARSTASDSSVEANFPQGAVRGASSFSSSDSPRWMVLGAATFCWF